MRHLNFLKSFLLLCALVVGSNVWGADSFKKVTSASEIADGKQYVLICESSNVGMAVYSSGTYCASLSVTISSNKVTYVNNLNVLTIEATDGGWYFKQANGNYLYSSAAKSLKAENTTNKTVCTITDDFQITMGTSGKLQYNASSPRFCPYTSSQTAAYLYIKEEASTDPTITFNNGTVRVGKSLDLSTLFTSNSSGDVLYSITAGDSYASISGNMLTGIAVGSVTVKAEQAAAGSFKAGEASATITVQEALTLSSIAITTAPSKTTYTEGEIFDATGMVVTATYSDSSTDDVTASCTWTPNGALSPSNDKITVSYTENGTTKTAEQTIIVNEYVQPTTINMSLNNSFFGTSYTGANAKGSGSHQGSADNVTVDFISGGDKNNFYISDTEIRAYSGNTLKFTAPSKYLITKIVFTNAWATGTTVNDGTLSSDRKTWSNMDGSDIVSFTPTSKSDITSLIITLSPTASIAANKEWITYTSKYALDFSEDITGLEGAYTITSHSAGATTLTATKMTGTVKAGTGLLLHAAAVDADNAQEIAIPVAATGTEQADNMLVGVTSATTVNPTDGTKTNLGLKNGSFVPYSAAGTLAAGKAYLQIPTADMPSNGSKLTIIFDDDETTGIDSIHNSWLSQAAKPSAQFIIHNYTPMFNLSGQRVSESYKGIVIVNGKKYIRK